MTVLRVNLSADSQNGEAQKTLLKPPTSTISLNQSQSSEDEGKDNQKHQLHAEERASKIYSLSFWPLTLDSAYNQECLWDCIYQNIKDIMVFWFVISRLVKYENFK